MFLAFKKKKFLVQEGDAQRCKSAFFLFRAVKKVQLASFLGCFIYLTGLFCSQSLYLKWQCLCIHHNSVL